MAVSKIGYFLASGGQLNRSRRWRYRRMAHGIIRRSQRLANVEDTRLTELGRELQWRARAGTSLERLLPEAFALVREAARRTLGYEHFPVQIMGAIALFEGHIAEMQTGEGKTLTATMPAFLRALPGRGCHIVTVNDYLAERDRKTMGPIYERLGLSIGCILTDMQPDERRAQYGCDITYGTAKELGFDFLRDRLRLGASKDDPTWNRSTRLSDAADRPVQRGHYFALLDEADSILIDEARTPLIIGLAQPNDAATVNLFRWSNRAVQHLRVQNDYVWEPDRRAAYLTDDGCRRLLLMSKPSLLNRVDTERIYTQIEQALIAQHGFQRDRDYVVVEDKVVIVDESTGRLMDGRKWQDGLHQAVEAKELVPITAATGQAARVTVQSFFRRYSHLAGMTGTAVQARRELRHTYRLKVTVIPTNKKCIRHRRPTRVFATLAAKHQAVATQIKQLTDEGRAVLVGTPSVEASEALGARLEKAGIEHQILNARFHAQEAAIVAQAGQPRRVTIATNMAGRGTDILLDPSVQANGGLQVIATEMHTSARIDRQLIGRAARQGDPGSYQFFLSLEDELLRCLEAARRQRLCKQAVPDSKGELPAGWVSLFRRTQRFLERQHRKQRKSLLKAEKHRSQAYRNMGLDPYLELTES